MRMRPLIIDNAAKAAAARVLKYAEAHHWYPAKSKQSPGDDPNFVAQFGTYCAVFTFTHSDDLIWRHLSISVPGILYPNPAAAFVIAELFGFTGWDGRTINQIPEGWLFDVNERDHCITVVQPCGKEGSVVH